LAAQVFTANAQRKLQDLQLVRMMVNVYLGNLLLIFVEHLIINSCGLNNRFNS